MSTEFKFERWKSGARKKTLRTAATASQKTYLDSSAVEAFTVLTFDDRSGEKNR